MTLDEQSENALPSGRFRYSWAGDEFLYVEISDAMSLDAVAVTQVLAAAVAAQGNVGVIDICPINCSILIRFDPGLMHPRELRGQVEGAALAATAQSRQVHETRILEIPIWYDDPATREQVERFRSHRQRPDLSDLEYIALVNGLSGPGEVIDHHSREPWIVTGVGFVAGLPWMFQLTTSQYQMEVPKYLIPRTEQPPLGMGMGGCFSAINTSSKVGGYQLMGTSAAAISATDGPSPAFDDSMFLFRSGDIVKFRAVDEAEFREIRAASEAGEYRFKQVPVVHDHAAWVADPHGYNKRLLEELDGSRAS